MSLENTADLASTTTTTTNDLAYNLKPNPEALAAATKSEAEEARIILERDAHDSPEAVRDAFGKMISRVEELSTMLTEAFKAQAELETQLVLTKSNLQLALANTEMLEDALKREDPDRGKSVGWRRWSVREGIRREAQIREESPLGNQDSTTEPDLRHEGYSQLKQSAAGNDYVADPRLEEESLGLKSSSLPQPLPKADSRFFGFRLRSRPSVSDLPAPVSAQPSPTMPTAEGSMSASHLTSASMPSLALPNLEAQRELELKQELESERQRHRATISEKTTLEGELESLSQALFEEANKMVATERMRMAELDDELQSVREEKEALRRALKLIEGENGRLRTISQSPGRPPALDQDTKSNPNQVSGEDTGAPEEEAPEVDHESSGGSRVTHGTESLSLPTGTGSTSPQVQEQRAAADNVWMTTVS